MVPPRIHRSQEGSNIMEPVVKQASEVHKIVFACEAGMGSSLIGANQLKKKVKKAKLDVTVIHAPVHEIPADADIVVAHKGLAERAKKAAPQAVVISFMNFVNNPVYDQIVNNLVAGEPISTN